MIDIVGYISAGSILPVQYIVKYYFCKNFLGFKSKGWKFILCLLLLTAFDFCIARAVSETVRIILNIVLYMLVICLLCKQNFVLKLYAAIVQDASLVLISITFFIFDFKFSTNIFKIKMNFNEYLVLNFISNTVSDLLRLLLLYILLKYICKLLKIKEKQVNAYQGLYLLIPCLATYGLSEFFYVIQEIKIGNNVYYLPNIFQKIYYILPFISCGLLLSIIITAYTFNKMLEGEDEKQKNMLVEQQFKLQLEHGKNMENLYGGIRSVIHDMNNHLACLRNLADAGRTEEIKKYISNISETINRLDFKIKTGNPVSDAVINEKCNVAKMYGIEFLCEFICPHEISVEPMDLCIILSNILDNAIEACQRIESSNVIKTIKIKSYLKNKYLIIEVSNTKDNVLKYNDSKIISTKPDAYKHGIGISNVEDAVKKYNGATDIIEEKNKFTINVMLPLF